MIRANAARYPISAQCRIPDVPRSTYYWMTGHPGTERADPIAGDVRAIWRDSRGRYGARKIKAALERKGVTASKRRIGGIMRERGMRARTRADGSDCARRGPTRPGPRTCRTRGSDGYVPHARPAGDLTSVRVGGGWAYVCLLAGLADRGIAGHSAGRPRDAGLVLAAFAALDFPLTDVQVFHADRGGGFDDTGIDEPLDVFDVKRSLPRRGSPYGNAVVESTDRLLKKELVYRNHYATVGQPRRGPDDCVWWSDDQRLHSTLGYRSPKEFTERGLVL